MKIEINNYSAGKVFAIISILMLFMLIILGYGYENGISIEAWDMETVTYLGMMGGLFSAFMFFYFVSFIFTMYAKIEKLQKMIKEGCEDDNRR